MKRLFGSKKAEVPAPSLNDAASGIGGRVDQLDEKIKKLDGKCMTNKTGMNNTTKQPSLTTLYNIISKKRKREKERKQIRSHTNRRQPSRYSK